MGEDVSAGRIGFVGLGNMGSRMSANIAKSGLEMIVYDIAGTAERAPEGATIAASVAEVAAEAETVFLSLPHGGDSASVAEEVIARNDRAVRAVVDTSTIGIAAARAVQERLADAEIEYVDAPVSGGIAGAAAGTISVMFSGAEVSFQRLHPVLSAMSCNVFHVGTEPGQGQAMKVINNVLSATAMAATSEAIAFGMTQDLDMAMMIDVLNASSGKNTATSDKFPNRVIPGTYDTGFTNILLAKDLRLYLEAVHDAGTADAIAGPIVDLVRRFTEVEPGADMTRLYPFVRDSTKRGSAG